MFDYPFHPAKLLRRFSG